MEISLPPTHPCFPLTKLVSRHLFCLTQIATGQIGKCAVICGGLFLVAVSPYWHRLLRGRFLAVELKFSRSGKVDRVLLIVYVAISILVPQANLFLSGHSRILLRMHNFIIIFGLQSRSATRTKKPFMFPYHAVLSGRKCRF